MSIRHTLPRSGLLGATLAALLSGCADAGIPTEMPIGEPDVTPLEALIGTYSSQALITCDVTMATLAVECGSPQDPFGSTPEVGGRGMHTRLVTSGATYDVTTRIFTLDVSVQNLLVQQLGTPNGTVTGFRPFFTQIFRTGGSGTITLLNADGTANFTASDQPYFHYHEKLPSLGVSAPRTWEFNVGHNITSWRFRVYVSAETMPVVVFDKEVNGNRDIYRVALDGTDLVRLTTNAAADLKPTVAVGKIVFATYRTGHGDLYWMLLRGGTQSRMTSNPADQLSPSLSSDGTRLAYTDNRSGIAKIYSGRIDPITGSLQNTTIRTAKEGNPASPEASPVFVPGTTNRIAFVATYSGSPDIYTMQFPQSAVPFITHAAADVEPAYSPDGQYMAFTSTRDGNPEIYIRVLSSGVIARLTNHAGYDGQPAFLPDNRVVYVSDVGGTRHLRWIDPGTLATGVIPTGAGIPRNPAVALLY
jgi:Tol biopolymer transport system component